MKEDKSLLMPRAMTYGLIMGVAWSIKYLFFIFGMDMPILSNLYWGCTLAVPFAAYLFTKQYRMEIGGTIGTYHAWQFGVLVYFFAALIVSLSHYVFYAYLAPADFITNAFKQTMSLFEEADMKDVSKAMESMDLSPIQMTIQQIFNNVFYGMIFSLPVALLLKRNANKKTNP